jgi:hypothetical protein
VYAAIDLAEPAFLKGTLTHGTAGGLVRRVITKSLQGGALETVQEGIQTAMEQSFRSDLTPQQKMSNIVDAAVTGGAIGGVFGGLGGVRSLKHADAGSISTDQLDQVTASLTTAPQAQQPMVQTDLDLRPPAAAFPAGHQGDMLNPSSYEELDAARALQDAPTDELHAIAQQGATYFENLPPDHRPNQNDALLRNKLRMVEAELQARNIPESSDSVASPTVEAVEPGPPALGAVGGAQAAPVSAPTFADRLTELKKGLRLPGQFVASISGAKNENQLLETVHDQIFDQQDTRPTVQKLAQRLGLLDDQLNPTPLADAMGARKAEQAGPAVEADPEFQKSWSTLIEGTRDKTIRQLKPANEEDAARKVYAALTSDRAEVSDRLEKIGQAIGLLDDDMRPTAAMANLARRAIPFGEAETAALNKGFKGVEVNHFDRGARFETDNNDVRDLSHQLRQRQVELAKKVDARIAAQHSSLSPENVASLREAARQVTFTSDPVLKQLNEAIDKATAEQERSFPEFANSRERDAFLAGHEWAHPDTLPEAQTKAEMREMGLGETSRQANRSQLSNSVSVN